MNNSIYLKFDWDNIIKQEKWILDFSVVKGKILEQVYVPNGWDVIVGKTATQQSLTILDTSTIYYTLYGTFDVLEQCFIATEIDLIFLPRETKNQTNHLIFVASPTSNSIKDWNDLRLQIQHPITSQLLVKQQVSYLKNELQQQLQPLKVKRVSTYNEANRFMLELEELQEDLITNSYEKYVLYRLEQQGENSIQVLQEQALEVGYLESWDEQKKQLTFTYQDENIIPSKKGLKKYKFFLIRFSAYTKLVKLKETTNPLLVQSARTQVDHRAIVKQLLKPLFEPFQVNLNWSASSQFFYYANETVKGTIFQELVTRLIASKRPITAIVEPHTVPLLEGKGYLEKAVNFDELNFKIQSFNEIKQRFEKNQAITKATTEEIKKVKIELEQLQQEIKALEDVRMVQYDAAQKEKQIFNQFQEHKELLESKLNELESTKKYLLISSEELKEQLLLNLEQEKRLKKSIEKLYAELNEFKKSEKNYQEIFQHTEKYTETQKSLKQLETRLKQYKQLSDKIESSLDTVTNYLVKPFEEQRNKLTEIITLDLTFKLTDQVEEMRNILLQLNQQVTGADDHAVYMEKMTNYSNGIHHKFQSLRINVSASYSQPLKYEAHEMDSFIRQLYGLLDHPPNRIISTLSKKTLREWQQRVIELYEKFIAGYTYLQQFGHVEFVQKQDQIKQAQLQIHRYAMRIKNGLHDKKHEMVNRFMRKTEIEISEIYFEMFKLNRYKEDVKSKLSFFDESLNEQTFKEKKSSLQLQLTEFISSVRNVTKAIQAIYADQDDYIEKLTLLDQEFKMQEEELYVISHKYGQAKRQYDKLFTKYKDTQEQTNFQLNNLEAKGEQLEQLEEEKQHFAEQNLQYQEITHLQVIETFYEQRNEINPSITWLNIVSSQDMSNVSGITVIENIQNLSPLALKEIAQRADYIISFIPLTIDRTFSRALQIIESQKLLPNLVDNLQLYDESVVELLTHFYSTNFKVEKKPHYISTKHIRNDQYVTWIKLGNEQPIKAFEMLLLELHESKKVLTKHNISENKVRVKLFSDELSVFAQVHKNLKDYALRYHHVKMLKQHDQDVDLFIIHVSDDTSMQEEQLNLLKSLLLTGKPLVVLSSANYLKKREIVPISDVLNRFQRIKEGSREKQWATSIKPKE